MPHPLMISCNKLKFLNSTSSYGLSNSWIASNTKRCPKCKSSIEKNQGCDHMTCKYCGNQFCWLCLSQYYGHSIGDSFCQTSAKIALENQVKRKEKAELYCSYLDNFSKISEKYVEKNNNIEKKKMHLLEKLKSQSHKFDVKIKKNAENFGIYIFGII